ncbi:hypothetical protein Pryu01_01776 [Paraliobacillus ryukyuensis]|uniref:Quinol oxidase subunit 2 n=1 Tax=Paraliobacillus ryukyuensis TaxID=200904 RepID=A0A366E7E7_9BACI|nr:cytochrome aa3 quinol oxidase subunit II [Paraliobacillus ryukyuensis]RBO98293.1 cytochrome aa3 quinol oxidase subunit 2 [Paraliobacillus ryukyuensis]
MKRVRSIMKYVVLFLGTLALTGCEPLTVFDPQGPVARNLSDLIIFSIIFMAVIVITVFILFGVIVWKYREKKDNKDYEPEFEEGSKTLEVTWFLIPVVIVVALTIPTVKTITEVEDIPEGYDDQEPLVIHVTSADWKWIFSYPEEGIETVNYINIPVDRPVHFKMTSAGTMQSMWIPALAGQKYTMANMQTQLYLVADREGDYMGTNNGFNGEGYAEMDFDVSAQSPADYTEWVEEVKNTAKDLTEQQYAQLLEPTIIGRQTYNGTHLQWVDHAQGGSEKYIDTEAYYTGHGTKGKTFDSENDTQSHEREQDADDQSNSDHQDEESQHNH